MDYWGEIVAPTRESCLTFQENEYAETKWAEGPYQDP